MFVIFLLALLPNRHGIQLQRVEVLHFLEVCIIKLLQRTFILQVQVLDLNIMLLLVNFGLLYLLCQFDVLVFLNVVQLNGVLLLDLGFL